MLNLQTRMIVMHFAMLFMGMYVKMLVIMFAKIMFQLADILKMDCIL